MPLGRPWAFERGTLWALELDGAGTAPHTPPAPAPTTAGATFSELTPSDAQALAAAMGMADPGVVRARFADGRRCFAAYVAGALAAYGWASQGTERIGELERTLRMLPGEAYIWECATLPRYRRRGLYSALLCHIVGVLRAEGLRRLWIGASLDNAPSIRAFRVAGFRPVITLAYLRLLGLRRIWLRGDATAPPELIAAARRALTGGDLPQDTQAQGTEAASRTAMAQTRERGAEET